MYLSNEMLTQTSREANFDAHLAPVETSVRLGSAVPSARACEPDQCRTSGQPPSSNERKALAPGMTPRML